MEPPKFFTQGAPKLFLNEAQAKHLAKINVRPPVDPHAPRGIVLLPAWRIPGTSQYLRRASDVELMRRALLYWDRMVWPTIDDVRNPLPDAPKGCGAPSLEDELAFLCDAEILYVNAVLNGVFGGASPAIGDPAAQWRFHKLTYLNLDFHEPGAWALADTSQTFEPPEADARMTRSVLCTLVNALPSPAEGVPFADILKFKEKYASELLALRARLDLLYGELIKAADFPHEQARVIRDLSSAIEDLWRATESSPGRFVRKSVTTVLDVGHDVLEGFGIGAAVAPVLNLPLLPTLMGGAALGALRMAWRVVTKASPAHGPFAYLYLAAEDEIIKKPLRRIRS